MTCTAAMQHTTQSLWLLMRGHLSLRGGPAKQQCATNDNERTDTLVAIEALALLDVTEQQGADGKHRHGTQRLNDARGHSAGLPHQEEVRDIVRHDGDQQRHVQRDCDDGTPCE